METKRWYQSNTIRFNLVVMVVESIALAISMATDLGISGQILPWLLFFHGIGNIVLRLITSKPIGNGEAEIMVTPKLPAGTQPNGEPWPKPTEKGSDAP